MFAVEMNDNLRVRLGQAIENHVGEYMSTYENNSSGINDVKQFYYAVADILEKSGFTDDEILNVYRTHGGNYLLGKKYGVSYADFAKSILEDKERYK